MHNASATEGAAKRSDESADGGGGSMRDAAQNVRAQAGAIFEDAKESARSKLNEQKGVAAQGLDNVAGALRKAGQHGDDGENGHDPIAALTGSAADALTRVSSALRNKDVSAMLRDVEVFARSQPIAFFGLALATGFMAVRFLKASDDASTQSSTPVRTPRGLQEDTWTPR
ncbi:MAG: hypothetical protein ABIW85_05785 [Variovorax sp.]